MGVKPGVVRSLLQTIGSLRTGIILLILVGITSAAGTLILQRPITDPQDIQAAYSPQTLRLLDSLGLTDVYHSWWYVTLLSLLGLSIILVSLDRWPNAWRYYSRPYRRTDASFRAVLPLQKTIPISDPQVGLDAAERAFRRQGLKAERIVENDEVSLYAEKSRYAVLAVYVVHSSLLLIMLGGIVDGIWGYKGYVNLIPGQPAVKTVELRDGKTKALPFELGCEDAGQENYTGQFAMMPKRWWSKLVVSQNGKEVERKEIAVNDPLVRNGIRFYQSGYGASGNMRRARLGVVDLANPSTPRESFELNLGSTVALADGSRITLVKFLPDSYAMDGAIYQRSKNLGNAAAEIQLATKDGKVQQGWLVRTQSMPQEVVLVGPYNGTGELLSGVPYQLVASVDMLPFTGLQVSYEPGQWGVWAGCVLMALGLVMAFWVLHQRYWAVPVINKEGRLVLWVGAAANKNREGFAGRFGDLTREIEKELENQCDSCQVMEAASAVRT
ncbi:MAG: cytochrome c biogenesis protein ResB [Terriglobales bacterium]